MSNEYSLKLTRIGTNKLMEAQINNVKVKVKEFAVGDSGLPPNPEQTGLKNERWRGEVNRVYLDPTEESRIRVESVIPANVGGWWIREVGLIDEDGDLIAIAKYPETWKPSIESGTARETAITFIIQLSDTELIELVVDPNTVLVTQQVLKNELDLFRREINLQIQEQNNVISTQQVQIDLLSKAIERIMIEMELEQKLKEGYAFFTALDGLAKGMSVNNGIIYLPIDYADGMEVKNDIEATSGETLTIFDANKTEDFTAEVSGDNIIINGLTESFSKGAAITRSTARLDEATKDFVPSQYKLSDITSEVV